VCRFVPLKKKTFAFETPTGRDDFPAERAINHPDESCGFVAEAEEAQEVN